MNFNSFSGKGTDKDEVLRLAQTLPFAEPRRVIYLEDTGFFKGSSDEELLSGLSSLPDTTVIIFFESAVDKNGKLFKLFKKDGEIFDFDNFINVNDVKSNLSENKNNIDQIRKQVDNKSTVVETQTINNKEVQFKQVALEDVFNKKVIGNKNNQETQSNTKLQEEHKKEKQEVIEIKPKVEIEQETKLESETKSKNKAKEEKQKPKDEAKTKGKKSKQQEQEILVDEKLDELNNFENNKDNKKVSILDALLNKSFKTNNYKLSQVKHNFNAQTKIKPETIVDANEISENELKHNFKDEKNDNKVSKKNKDNNSSQVISEPNLFTLDFGDNSDNDYLVQPKVELKQEEIKSPTKKEDKQQISKQKEEKQQNNSEDKKSEVKDELDLELEKKLKILSSGVDREKLFFQIADNKNNDNKTTFISDNNRRKNSNI